jgi:hypothetical protein
MGITPGSLGNLTSDQRKYLNTLQDNARQDPNIKNFADVRASYETARSAASQPGGAGDIVLMRMLAKITDPTTGVREEEFNTFAGAQGTLAKYGITLTQQMWSGGRLTEAGRNSLMKQATDIYGQRRSAYDSSVNFYDKQATDAGLPTGMVTSYYSAPDSPASGDSTIDTSSLTPDRATATSLSGRKDASGTVLGQARIDQLSRDVTYLRGQGYTDEEVRRYLNEEMGFSNVGGDTKSAAAPSTLASRTQATLQRVVAFFRPGMKAGQCGRFVNNLTGIGMGDAYTQKLSKCDRSIRVPKPGDVFVMPTGDSHGHTGIVERITYKADGKTPDKVYVIDSNWSKNPKDERVRRHAIAFSRITGYARPGLKTDFTNNLA